MAKVRVLREPETGQLVTVCRTRSEFEAACDVHCSGFREDNAVVSEHDTDAEDCPADVTAFLARIRRFECECT